MDFQNGRIFKEIYHFYSFWAAFAPHHGLLRENILFKNLRNFLGNDFYGFRNLPRVLYAKPSISHVKNYFRDRSVPVNMELQSAKMCIAQRIFTCTYLVG